jgi:hypothetical protein
MDEEELWGVGVDSGWIFIVDPAAVASWQPGDWDRERELSNSYHRALSFGFEHGDGAVEGGVLIGSFRGDGFYSAFLYRDHTGRFVKATVFLDLEPEGPIIPIAPVTTTTDTLLVIDPCYIKPGMATEAFPPAIGGTRVSVGEPGVYQVSIQGSATGETALIIITPLNNPVEDGTVQ